MKIYVEEGLTEDQARKELEDQYRCDRYEYLQDATRMREFYKWVETVTAPDTKDRQENIDMVVELCRRLRHAAYQQRFSRPEDPTDPPMYVTATDDPNDDLDYNCPVCSSAKLVLHSFSFSYRPWSPGGVHCIECGTHISSTYGMIRAFYLSQELACCNEVFSAFKEPYFEEKDDGLYLRFDKPAFRFRVCNSLVSIEHLHSRIKELRITSTFHKATSKSTLIGMGMLDSDA